MDINDNITALWDRYGRHYTYTNEDFRNTGIEVSCDIHPHDTWSYHYGMTWQDPESKSSKKGYWDRTFGKLQFTGGVTYHKSKLTTSLEGSYLADRVQNPSKGAIFPYETIFFDDLEYDL
jgi:iron complex outermembrane receptor protein